MPSVILLPTPLPGFGLNNFSKDPVSYNSTLDFASTSGLWFNSDGTKMAIGETGTGYVATYSLPTPWDLTSISAAPGGYDFRYDLPASGEENVMGIHMTDDGETMWVCGNNDDQIQQYSLSTAWNVTTATQDGTQATGSTYPSSVRLSADGTKAFVVDRPAATIKQWTLGTAFDITGTFTAGSSFDISTQIPINQATGLAFAQAGSQAGKKMFVTNGSTDVIWEYDLSTAWDVSTATVVQSKSTAPGGIPHDPWCKPDGTKIYIIDQQSEEVDQFSAGS